MFIICMVISCGIVIIAAQIITSSAVRTITDNSYNNIYENIRYADSNISSFLEDAVAITMAISFNRSIIIEGLEDDSPVASYSAFEMQKEVEAHLLNIRLNKIHISMAAVIGIDGKSFQSGGSLILRRIINEPWFIEALHSSGTRIFYNTPGFNNILICRPIIFDREVAGLAVVEMDFQVLNNVYYSMPLTQSLITSFDDSLSIVFTNYNPLNIRTVDQSPLAAIINSYNPDQRYWYINRERFLIVSFQSPLNGLTTMALIPYADLISAAWHINFLMVIIIAFSIAAAALASWIFSRVFCKNIYLLQDSMQKIQDGNMEIRSQIKSRDEIGIMSNIFNSMMDRIKLLLQNIRET